MIASKPGTDCKHVVEGYLSSCELVVHIFCSLPFVSSWAVFERYVEGYSLTYCLNVQSILIFPKGANYHIVICCLVSYKREFFQSSIIRSYNGQNLDAVLEKSVAKINLGFSLRQVWPTVFFSVYTCMSLLDKLILFL